MNERIEELQEMKDEYILNETSLEIGQKSVSWGELADMQADAEARWNETDEGRELTLLEKGASEITIELYKALKATYAYLLGEFTHLDFVETCKLAEAAIRKAEGE